MKKELVLNVVEVILTTLSFCFLVSISSTSIYPIIVFLVLLFLYKRIKTSKSVSIIILSVLFSIFLALGKYQIILENNSVVVTIIKVIVIIIGSYIFFRKTIDYLYNEVISKKVLKKNKITKPWLFFVLALLFISICYVICWLAEYPGPLSPDTIDQFNQIKNGVYTNHHPFAHTMYLKLLMSFGKNYLESMGIASLIQLVINSIVFSYVSTFVYRKTSNLLIGILTVLFYSLISYQAFYSITLFKDTTHAVITVLLLILMFEYIDSSKKIYLILITIFSIGFCLFRSNGYYAFIPLMVFAMTLLIKKRDKLLCLSVIIALVIATIIKGPIYSALNVSKASFIEPLSIPLQQVSLVIKNERKLDEKDKWLLEELLDTSKVGEEYNPILSDPIKKLVNTKGNEKFFKDHIFEYIKMYIKLGIKNPADYLKAWVNQTSGFFYPAKYYQNFFTGVWDNNLDIVKAPKIDNDVVNKIEDLSYSQHTNILVGIFHNPSCIAWIMLFLSFFFIDRKEVDIVFLLIPLVMIWLSLLVSVPFNMEFRYMYSVTCCLPVLCVLPFIYRKD